MFGRSLPTRLIVLLGVFLLAAPGVELLAQTSKREPSLAEIAKTKTTTRKAKKVWTNEDFPERAQPAAEQKKESAEGDAEAAKGPVTEDGETLDDLKVREESADRQVVYVQEDHDRLTAEITELEKQYAQAPLAERAALEEQIRAMKAEQLAVYDRLTIVQFEARQIKEKIEKLVGPPPPHDMGLQTKAAEGAANEERESSPEAPPGPPSPNAP